MEDWDWRPDLVGVFELQAGDDLTFQFAVRGGLGQDGLAELWDVSLTGFPQHWVEPVVYRDKDLVQGTDSSKLLISFWLLIPVF